MFVLHLHCILVELIFCEIAIFFLTIYTLNLRYVPSSYSIFEKMELKIMFSNKLVLEMAKEYIFTN